MNIETKVRNYLDGKIDVPVFIGNPKEKPLDFVSLSMVDYDKTDRIEHATIELTSYGETKEKASRIFYEVLLLMEGIITDDEIFASHVSSASNTESLDTHLYSYTCYFNLTY